MRYTYCCPCLFGVEGLVSQELKEMGCENVRAENGRVLFDGDWQMAARVNINSRYAERVLILLKSCTVKSFEELFQAAKSIQWEEHLAKDDEFPVSGSCLSSKLHSVPDCQAIIKKAVVERMKQKHKVSWFSETGPLHRIRFLIIKDVASIMIDLSGEGLHKRGYRKNSTDAPIKETLAAAMAKLARVRRDGHVIDPFCGSGTILIESATLALNIAPGLKRKFNAETWNNLPKKFWREERQRAEEAIIRDSAFMAEGFDIDPAAVELTLENAKKAGVLGNVTVKQQDIKNFADSSEYGCVICNPPYGERLLDIQGAREIYKIMGKKFVGRKGWSYSIISPEEEFESLFGKKADKRRKLYNGMIKCQLYQYFK